jgi:hypothetical protein
MPIGRNMAYIIALGKRHLPVENTPHPWPETWKASHWSSRYLSWPVLDNLWSLSYLSTKYSKIARVSLHYRQRSTVGDGDSEVLPNNEIVVVVVDDSRDATIRIDLQVFWSLLLFLAEIEIHRFVRQSEFFEDDHGFPNVQVLSCP